MPIVVGIKLAENGSINLFTPGENLLVAGDEVIVEACGRPRLGRVVYGPRNVSRERIPVALRRVTRVATEQDRAQAERNRALLAEAAAVVPEAIHRLRLPMKVIGLEAEHDGPRIIVYFAADGRVDFRALVHDLVRDLGVRVLMHQVGARDHAKLLGGFGSCGREICCASWMHAFEPISMRMAKEQSLFLNPAKFSGNCGKLKCCLRYEFDFYTDDPDPVSGSGEAPDVARAKGSAADRGGMKGPCSLSIPRAGFTEAPAPRAYRSKAEDTQAPDKPCPPG